jgi:SNF2 family DNA or RNA helicase
MGLGKSVEMIALMLGNKYMHSERVNVTFKHNDALVKRIEGYMVKKLADSTSLEMTWLRATLIVSPMSIVYQWKSEIAKHAPSMNVLIYDGVRRAQRKLTTSELQGYDVVLTTYNVLAEEVNYSKNVRFELRGIKKYMIPETPLLNHVWHRVVLDEAQYVRGSVSACATMACRLVATHRWCVSGTPIGRHGLEDLYGLMVFLGQRPYNERHWWKKAVDLGYSQGLDRLQPLLKQLMWRHSKSHVTDEVDLPPLVRQVIQLEFSPVEEEYYRRFLLDIQSKVYVDSARVGTPRSLISFPSFTSSGPNLWYIVYQHRDC